jgi:hypothetical protein
MNEDSNLIPNVEPSIRSTLAAISLTTLQGLLRSTSIWLMTKIPSSFLSSPAILEVEELRNLYFFAHASITL